MKNYLRNGGYIAAGMVAFSGVANASLDFTNVTSAVTATEIVTAISAIAAIKILPGVAIWGYGKVVNWFPGK